MPRNRKEPYLYKRPARYDTNGKRTHKATFIIRDGDDQIATGCGFADVERARQLLRDYIVRKYADKPLKKGREEEEVFIADLLRYYLEANVDWIESMKGAKRRWTIKQFVRLNDFWGGFTVDQINKANSKKYQENRNPHAARQELVILRAAVNFGASENQVKLTLHHNYAMPPKAQGRMHYLSLQEVIALYKAARRRQHTFNGVTTHRVAEHVARFIVFALMTGTRSDRVSRASFHEEPGRPWIDLEHGIFYRRADQEFVIHNKRAEPIRLPDRLLRLLRKWYRLDKRDGIPGFQYLIHYDGRSVDCRKAFYTLKNIVFTKARARQVNRHVLKHTCVTWLLQEGVTVDEVAAYVSTTPDVIRKVYSQVIPGANANINAVFSNRRVGQSRSKRAIEPRSANP
ncbi:hypothetical protein ELG69_10360 [Rhizobium leguminosarum]|uniref:hypothetical protein n=1 Tax=Rhizobium leguminosarum TaxID=384 RepID=UPI0010318B3D|nr:hypothetical protein [Rhizobium leguminosarum]TBG84482.1 hypothetical protein ELG69_10360 [Rhizobium leguminosarum]